jgi:hypothetical protein
MTPVDGCTQPTHLGIIPDMKQLANNTRTFATVLAVLAVLTTARLAGAADGFEDQAPYLTDPFARWHAVGMTFLFAALVAACGFKDSKRTRLD